MIFELIIKTLIKAYLQAFEYFPTISFDFLPGLFDVLSDAVFVVHFFIPLVGLLPLILFSIFLDFTKMIIAAVVRIKSFIPTMGA